MEDCELKNSRITKQTTIFTITDYVVDYEQWVHLKLIDSHSQFAM